MGKYSSVVCILCWFKLFLFINYGVIENIVWDNILLFLLLVRFNFNWVKILI